MQVLSAVVLTLGLLTSNVYAAAVMDGNYIVDRDHTNVGFEVSHMGISLVIGRFNRFQGSVNFTANGDSKVSFEIQTASVDTSVARRDDHLRTADFFDVERFPKMVFESTSVEYQEDGTPKLIHGQLTLHGVTKPVSLEVTPVGTGTTRTGEFRAGFVAKTVIKRTDFGMDKLLAAASDDVTINLHVELLKQ